VNLLRRQAPSKINAEDIIRAWFWLALFGCAGLVCAVFGWAVPFIAGFIGEIRGIWRASR